MTSIQKNAPGILLCLLLALPAWFLGRAFPIIGGPVFGIVLGMLLISLFPSLQQKSLPRGSSSKGGSSSHGAASPSVLRLQEGIHYTAKKLLQYSIILLGFEMNLFRVIQVGKESLFVMLFTLTTSFVVACLVGKALNINSTVTTLIGVGTSICGGSAIAATAPVIRAKDEDVAHSISTIFLFNIVAVFIFPALGHLLGMSDTGFGMWAGTAINDTSSVVAAGAAWSAAAGNDIALSFATIVKLTRTLMIVPITLVLSFYTARKQQRQGSGSFQFAKVFPWFVLGFVLAAILNTFTGLPPELTRTLAKAGKFLIVMAMAAIGLNTHVKKLVANGWRPICLGMCCWISIAAVSLAVQLSMKLW